MSKRPRYSCVYLTRYFKKNNNAEEEYTYGPRAVHVWDGQKDYWVCRDCQSTYQDNTETFVEGERLKMAQLQYELGYGQRDQD